MWVSDYDYASSSPLLASSVNCVLLGKIFALTTSMEMVSPLAAAPLYTSVYKATVAFYPGAFNFMSVGLSFLCYILMA